MRDGSDAIADWLILNALLNTASGASWVSVHGGGVGIGNSIHAGMVVVRRHRRRRRGPSACSRTTRARVMRHADAGHQAVEHARRTGLLPGLTR